MPINSGRKGFAGIVAIPGRKIGATRNRANQPTFASKSFRSTKGFLNTTLSGVSRDSSGATLGSCRVMIFRTEDNSLVGETTSDASGVWSISMLKGGPFFFVEYKVNSPDVFGTSLNTRTVAVG